MIYKFIKHNRTVVAQGYCYSRSLLSGNGLLTEDKDSVTFRINGQHCWRWIGSGEEVGLFLQKEIDDYWDNHVKCEEAIEAKAILDEDLVAK